MSHSCVQNYLHVIFSTKNCELLIEHEIEKRLYSYLVGIAKNGKTPIITINGWYDHLHILLKLHADVSLCVLIKELKSYSTSWMKK